MTEHVELLIVGAGAAGLMAGIWAGRTNPRRRILLLDGAAKLGAKILVSGGSRCNVTHDEVDASAYAGGSRNAIGKVLRRFDVPQTVAFFRELGVELKREETGKLFPVSDRSRDVLQALLEEARRRGVEIRHPCRVDSLACGEAGFTAGGDWGTITAAQVVLATGGKSLPKSGSDGGGYRLARELGHSLTPRIFPALVPLTVPPDHFIRSLSGLTLPTTLEVRDSAGRTLASFTGSTLCTHFGLSGPAVLDISRYYLDARQDDPQAALAINWWPGKTGEALDQELQDLHGSSLLRLLQQGLPERLARALLESAGLGPDSRSLTREARRLLVQAVTGMVLPITGSRGFQVAEVTAGGVPLDEVQLKTMESRLRPGLFFCGEILDVDGRIGGYNFQWAWSSGYTAGVSLR